MRQFRVGNTVLLFWFCKVVCDDVMRELDSLFVTIGEQSVGPGLENSVQWIPVLYQYSNL